jgi:serine/threonine protein kinase
MLYEMITSELPFQSDNAIGLLMHHLGTTPIAPHVRRPELNIPEAVSALVMKSLEKDRNNRFQTGDEFAQALISASRPALEHEGAAKKSTTNTFSTAALAAAASGATAEPSAGLTSPSAIPAQAKTAVVQPIAQTKVMGSTGMTVAPTQIKKRKKFLWIAIGAGALILAVIIWAMLPAKKSDEPQERPITFEDNSTPTTQREPRTTRRSQAPSGRSSEPAPRSSSSGVNDRLRSQQLTASGYRRMKDRDFPGATQDFQDALALDPSNTAAQKGLQTAQAGQTVKGITDIFHR